MARPGQAIATTLSRNPSDIYPNRDRDETLGTMSLLLKAKGANESLNHTEKD
jgi:hypothetical protein